MEAIYAGKEGGVLAVYNIKSGELITKTKLAAEPVFNGISVAKDKIYITLKNGTVASFN